MGGAGGLRLRRACAVVVASAAAVAGVGGVSAASSGATSTPDDPAFRAHSQWGLAQAGFPSAWCRATGAGTLIVVIDTGVSASQPDLAGKLAGEASVRAGAVTTGPGAAADDSGHGTHVAGIAAAVTGNGVGIAGAAPDARVYAIKVLFAGATGSAEGARSDLVQAIDYASTVVAPSWPGPVVINVSIGAADPSGGGSATLSGADADPGADVDSAIERAYAAGLGVALAAGNAGTSGIGGDAVAAGAALAVGALDQNGAVAPYSPTAGVSIFAAGGSASSPDRYTGTGILSTWLHSSSGDYAWMAGTSMAAPHVAAALALLMGAGMSNREAYSRLLSTADGQRRMHVDAAVGSTGTCGGGAASAAAAGGGGPARAGRNPAVVAPVPSASAAAAAATAAPVAGAPRLPSTGGVAPAAASVAARGGGSWLARIALGLGALVLIWIVAPRRLLRRVLSR
jgi:subtilisin family serine protease